MLGNGKSFEAVPDSSSQPGETVFPHGPSGHVGGQVRLLSWWRGEVPACGGWTPGMLLPTPQGPGHPTSERSPTPDVSDAEKA